MSKTLVAYFSATDTTARAAERLAKAIGADLHEIRPKVPYTKKDLNWTDPRSRSTLEMKDKSSRPEIEGRVENMDQYDTIYVGFPIWWYVAPTIINTFLESYDLSGKTVIPFQYQDFYVRGFYTTYQIFCDGIASVKNLNGKWGGIDKQGKTVIPFEYDALGTFLEGLAFACKDGKYGVINTQNNVVVPFEHTRITSYSNGLAVAVKDGRAFCIDRYGKEVPGSDTISQESYFPAGLESSLTMTPDEIITVIENGKYGFARIGCTQPLPQKGEMADWAYEEVIQAIQHDLVPSDLQNQYYANITRGDFAAIVVQLLEVVSGDSIEDIVLEDTGKTLEELALAYPFSDTNSWDVVAANALGVINGRGEGIFDPYSAISCQDAAALLMRMGKYMGKTDVDTSGETFADNASVASYAQEAVAYVKALGVMNGISETTFSPFDTYTRQQAYITMDRLLSVLEGESAGGEMTANQIFNQCSPAVCYMEVYDAAGQAIGTGSAFAVEANWSPITM